MNRTMVGLLFASCCIASAVYSTPNNPPSDFAKAAYSRWVVNSSSYGIMSTTSLHLNGTAFGNPVSFANVQGHVYFLVSPLDTSVQDLHANPKFSLSISAAEYSFCQVKGWDPEDPRCARLTLSGNFRNITGTNEEAAAKKALFALHPVMKTWASLGSHEFFFATIDIAHLWLIDFFGGAADIAVADYYKTQPVQLF